MCQFVVFRQVFFEHFIAKFDNQDFPNQIDVTVLKTKTVDIADLLELQKVMDGNGQNLELSDLEKLDNIVELLGLDKQRAIYFKNSRSLLSPQNQQDAF